MNLKHIEDQERQKNQRHFSRHNVRIEDVKRRAWVREKGVFIIIMRYYYKFLAIETIINQVL